MVTRASSGRKPRAGNSAYHDLNGSYLEAVDAADGRRSDCYKTRGFLLGVVYQEAIFMMTVMNKKWH